MERIWREAAKQSADPERVKRFCAAFPFDAIEQPVEAEFARVVASVVSGSTTLTELLLKHPTWISDLIPERLRHSRRRKGLEQEVDKLSGKADGESELRLFKAREMFRIGARDLARFAGTQEIIEEISNVADVCLGAVTERVLKQLQQKFGRPFVQDAATLEWRSGSFSVLGLGKLGGQELNYSSDLDLLFVHSGDGYTFRTTPKKSGSNRGIANSQFYSRLAETILNQCMRMTAEGFLYRIDLRLRPEGANGPIVRPLASFENYYAQFGQTWERMMLIKARPVAGDATLGAEFLEMIQPFRYPRSIWEQIPREVAEMKERIEAEVVRSGELNRNVKLGRGGIREIEFLVQTMQILQAGRNPFLQGAQTLRALDKMAYYGLITKAESSSLQTAYSFLRDVEHRLQMENNQQTHSVPIDPPSRNRLGRLMGFASPREFERALRRHSAAVRKAYVKVVSPKRSTRELNLPREVAAGSAAWRKILEAHSFRDPNRCLKLVEGFVQGPEFGHRSSRTVDHALQLIDSMLRLCPKLGTAPRGPFLSDPDRVLARLNSFIERYGGRAMLYDAWVSNPSLFRLLLLTFDRSEFLAELAIREPDLIDEIEQSGQLRRRKTGQQILADLRHGAHEADQHRWLRKYFQAEQMRIGLRDILDLASPSETQAEITSLADALLAYGLEKIIEQNKLKKAPFAVIGLGKVGGRELIYGSDLDLIFVANDKSSNLRSSQKLAVQLLELLSKRTEDGTTFAVDARLRPDGEKGPLVNTLGGYAEYYRKRAKLWEIQTLSRFRPIVGDVAVQQKFSEMAAATTNFSVSACAAYSSTWKSEIDRMRRRIQKERTPSGRDRLAIKTGEGGLMDVEFVAQTLCLEKGWHEPNTLAALARATSQNLGSPFGLLADGYRQLMQVERILRRWSFEPESLLPADPAAYYRVAVRCGFKEAGEFSAALETCRAKIREQYHRFFE